MANRLSAILATLLLGLAAVLFLAGCQTQPAAPAPTQAPAPTKAAQPAAPTAAPVAPAPTQVAAAPTALPATEPIKIGIMAPVTGSGARMGLNTSRFQFLAIDDVNGKGGVKVGGKSYRLEYVLVDDKGTADGGRDAASRLMLADKVRFISGGTSASNAGAQAITEQAKVLLVAASTTDKSLGPQFPLTFNVSTPPTTARTAAVAQWLRQAHPSIKRVAIAQPDDANGRAAADGMEKSLTEAGFTVVAKEFYTLETKDFAPYVTRILRQNPEAINADSSTKTELFVGFIKALREQGFKGPGFGVTVTSDAVKAAPAELEGYVIVNLAGWQSAAVPSQVKNNIQRYIQKYGEGELEIVGNAPYNNIQILAQAIEKAGSVDDVDKIAKSLREIEFDTMWSKELGKSRMGGLKTFGSLSVLESALYLSQVQNGKVDVIKAAKPVVP